MIAAVGQDNENYKFFNYTGKTNYSFHDNDYKHETNG